MSARRSLPLCAYDDEPRDGFDVPVYNRAGHVIGYRQSLRTLRRLHRLGGEFTYPPDLELKPFRQPITPGADANLRLLLQCAGVFCEGGPDWAWAPLEQAYQRFRLETASSADWPFYEQLFQTVLPDEFLGADITSRCLRRDGLRVEAYGMTYEIRDRTRYVAVCVDGENRYIPQGAGWAWHEALLDGRRRWRRGALYPIAATPELMSALAERSFGTLDVRICGELAMLPTGFREHPDQDWTVSPRYFAGGR